MKTSSIEPGLLQVFRLFAGLRLGLVILRVTTGLLVKNELEPFPITLLWFSFAAAAVLMAYLSWLPLQRLLKNAFLPIGLVIASLGPILEQYLVLREWTDYGPGISLAGAWQLIPLLFVPLVLIGWQYNFRSVVFFSLSTAFLDWGLTLTTIEATDLRLLALSGTLFIRTTSFLLVGYMVVRLMKNQRDQRRALSEANTHLAHYAATLEQLSTSRERNRLARELHDTLAHSLSGIAIQLEAVKTLWNNNPESARAMVEHSLVTTRSGLVETRRALKSLRASPLEDLGLALAIRQLAESVTARNGLSLDLEISERLENLSPDVEQGIYRIAQEALENVAQHAQARNVEVQLSRANGNLELIISDDGRGFNLENMDMVNRYGLQGMRERTEMLGGKLEVESAAGQGTTVRLIWEARHDPSLNL